MKSFLFPYSLMRVAGTQFNDLKHLRINKNLCDEIFALNLEIDNIKQKINNELYTEIGLRTKSDNQNRLLNLKRDIFNDRLYSVDEISEEIPLLTNNIEKLIIEYFSLKQSLTHNKAIFKTKFLKETEEIREKFKVLVNDSSLQKGLLLSSTSLFKRIDSYMSKSSDQFSRNDFKTELGLLKYLTRMKTKTSPFSTFTNLAITTHEANEKEIFSYDKARTSTKSHVRLNNAMFVYLKSLLFYHSEICPWFLISLNPTIRLEGKTFLFLINHQNIESFQRISFNPLLGLIRDLIKDHENQDLTFNKIVNKLTYHVEAPREEISDYITELIDFGFLEFELGVSGLDPDWDLKLREKLLSLEEENVPFIMELRKTLKEIRGKAIQVENVDISKREHLMKEAFDTFKKFCMKLHEAAGLPKDERMDEKTLKRRQKSNKNQHKHSEENQNQDGKTEKGKEPFRRKRSTWFGFKPETIFYEDTSLKMQINMDALSTETIIQSMDGLIQYFQTFDSWRQENEKMAAYFVRQYNKGKSVPLITFYESYYRDVKKSEVEEKKLPGVDVEKNRHTEEDKENELQNLKDLNHGKRQPQNIVNKSQEESTTARWQANVGMLLEASNLFQSDTIFLEHSHLEQISTQSGIHTEPLERTSFGMFIQFFNGKDKAGQSQLKGVINGVFPGFGRMMSRFLHLFDGELTEELRSWNQKLAKGGLLVENCDASCFNANIHPPLMPKEIRMPGSQNTLPEEKQLAITDLLVQEQGGQLYLKNRKNNKVVYTFDLGFQGFKGHSELYQLLSRFTLARFLIPHPLTSAVNKYVLQQAEEVTKKNEKLDIVVYPRIEYDDKLVLQRKHWLVLARSLPIQKQKETDSSYFLRVNRWRRSHGIPNEAFITVFPRRQEFNKKKKTQRIGRDDYKPQYIDFKNPLLLKLFSKLVKKVPLSMKIEEMLPSSDQLLRIDGKKFVTEHMVQWYHF